MPLSAQSQCLHANCFRMRFKPVSRVSGAAGAQVRRERMEIDMTVMREAMDKRTLGLPQARPPPGAPPGSVHLSAPACALPAAPMSRAPAALRALTLLTLLNFSVLPSMRTYALSPAPLVRYGCSGTAFQVLTGARAQARLPRSKAKERLATVEAARAVAACVTPGMPPVEHVSILPRGEYMARIIYQPQARPGPFLTHTALGRDMSFLCLHLVSPAACACIPCKLAGK